VTGNYCEGEENIEPDLIKETYYCGIDNDGIIDDGPRK